MALFKEFHEHRKFEKCLNTSFIALIPKKNDNGERMHSGDEL